MKHFKNALKSVSIGVFFGLYCSVPAMADDIEIYTSLGGNTVSEKPNVLFIIDNSGSMTNHVHGVRQRFDVSKSYAAGAKAATGCAYDESKVYYSTDGSQPACGSSAYFDLSRLQCDHAKDEYNSSGVQISTKGPLEVWGTYADQMSQRNASNVWGVIEKTNRPVECAQDQGIHGSNSAPTPNTYIVDTATGWQSSPTTPSVWSGGKNNYTLFHGKFLNYRTDTSVPDLATNPSRFEEVSRAMTALIDTNTSINVGLMTFDAAFRWPYKNGTDRIDGGGVIFPVEDINTGRTAFKTALNALVPISATPLSETYHEALQYFGGKPVRYGLTSGPASVPASMDSGGNYISPITNECQKNTIIVLTDGVPSHDNLTSAELALLPGFTDTTSCRSTGTFDESHCMDDMAAWALNNDVLQGTTGAAKGKQVITTHTVGFANANLSAPGSLIRLTATAGGGRFVAASNADTLRSEISKVFADTLKVNTTFSSPAVSVNAFNRSVHLSDLYFTLFKPDGGSHWPGNLKKYKLDFVVDTNDVDNDGNTTERIPFIADVNGNHAVNPNTGFFVANNTPGFPSVKSFWSDVVDGDVIEDGGAAGEFNNNAPRKVYTFTGNYTNANGVFSPDKAALTATVNKVDKTNVAITEAMLDIVGQPPSTQLPATTPSSTPRIETLLDWASGLDVFNKYGPTGTSDQRLEMGDPLHSQPALVQYGGSITNPDMVAYVATNDGYLHAIDVDNGKELFSFIPQELLPNLNVLMEDSAASKTYGLDGDVVAWVNDVNKDGKISGAGEHVYLYVGMRRGGNNIYSVDVTDRNAPKLRWVIKGGVGDYAELGQTWSSINVAKVKDASDPSGSRTVLIFGGGYDTNQDSATTRTPDSKGRAVYIADATSGQLLWSAGPGATLPLSEMKYSIPARITPLDISGDGNIDRLYAADMGGQVFRFDIDESTSSFSPASISGGRIADLAKDSSLADARRFYYSPDVALISERGKQAYLALAITSGYRAHPNNTDIHDRIYLLKDKDIYNAPATYVTLTESDLYNATLNLAGGEGVVSGNDTLQVAAKTALANAEGWYILLDDGTTAGNWEGEKGLSEALILEGTVIVTTFTPTPPQATVVNNCTLQQAGSGKVYFMNVLDATPVLSASTDKRPGRNLYGIAKSGIPPRPTVIVTKGGEPTLCVGTECKAADLIKGVRRTYWHEVEK